MRVRTHTNPLNIIQRFDHIELPDSTQELDIEIGFGKGVFLLNWAKQNPNHHVIGIEVRKQMVDLLAKKLKQEKLPHTTIFHGNGQYFINDAAKDNSINRIFIFHPDPWFKSKHHKRRVVSNTFLKLALQKLKPKGKIYISTDVEPLFEDMQTQFKEFKTFQTINDSFWETAYQTHWSQFSKTDKRDTFMQTYEKIITK
ncbi:MAG: tRNA (guanosine(46)-N7)-methyltransferase TrmB [Rickettsiales bacterium]|nr:tRNA (guanosine(46)-N7)-methyltransferase TrmB [Actinomycetota bacterium]MBA95646.1 tRNA (guanosine(46)-N7)-methyltransferase TrmB [Rickettsiales bacterium]MBE33903.1 tRNA (guanosine(46)-N7)-methyltransferase TrmB [bacterium]|tara:strand:- start:2033 stop:2629 length:597 start_codon:yes stop_codon:yes gene_type:complete